MNLKFFTFLLICLLPLFTLFSCQPQASTDDVRKVDSLQERLEKAEDNFVIDLDAIRERKDSMEQKFDYIRQNYNDSVSHELQTLLTEYRGLLISYGAFLTRIEKLEEENKKLRDRIENLKKDLLEGNVSKKDFNDYYKKEKEIVDEHINEVKESVKTIFQIEKQYQRDNKKVTELYQQLGKKLGDTTNPDMQIQH